MFVVITFPLSKYSLCMKLCMAHQPCSKSVVYVKNGTDSMPVPIDVMLFSSVRRGICKFSRLSRPLLNLPQGLSLDWLHV